LRSVFAKLLVIDKILLCGESLLVYRHSSINIQRHQLGVINAVGSQPTRESSFFNLFSGTTAI
jgi:hypothetical protein